MDYKTKPVSRYKLRKYAKILRAMFHVPITGAFPVLETLDKIGDVFAGSNYEIVEDSKLPLKTMARCMQNDEGGFTIEIKERVYIGAYEKNIGAYLGFICHEICHIFLFNEGFKPQLERGFDNNYLPAYCSVEWQAKALCAEVMIPFEESEGMNRREIVRRYHVSKTFADKRFKLGKKG